MQTLFKNSHKITQVFIIKTRDYNLLNKNNNDNNNNLFISSVHLYMTMIRCAFLS